MIEIQIQKFQSGDFVGENKKILQIPRSEIRLKC